jgi:MFS transporter, NNP family, nitrate/nitrite transporter
MTATTGQDVVKPRAAGKPGRWIADWRPEDWRPEDASFWERGGARVARRNLVFSIFSEHVGFSVWSLWSVFVLFLTPSYGISHDLKTAAAEKFLLTTLPTALGAGARLPYTFAVAKFGGRNWTIISASLLLVPTVAAAVALRPGASYVTLLVLAALAGVGGGNLGVAVVQLAGLAVLATAGKGHPRILLGIYIPLVVLAALSAALFMDNIAHARNEKRAPRDASRDPQTWIIAFLYIGTFGSFIGFSFAFGQVLQDQFAAHFLTAGKADPVKVACLTFLGPLLGSLSRPLGGRLADRIGGARTTFWSFVLMALAASVVLVNIAFRQSFLASGTGDAAYIGFIAFYVICICLTWPYYLRAATRRGLAGV